MRNLSWVFAPIVAGILTLAPYPAHAGSSDHQNYKVPGSVHLKVETPTYLASTVAEATEARTASIEARYGLDYTTAKEIASASAQRRSVVLTALSYLGTPYALWGSTHETMDCSGLTMVAYASVGVPMAHYVPSQDDAAPVHLARGQQDVGDLLVFDDQDHVAIYVGNGLLIQAPEPGRNVEVVPASDWDQVSWHVARYLP